MSSRFDQRPKSLILRENIKSKEKFEVLFFFLRNRSLDGFSNQLSSLSLQKFRIQFRFCESVSTQTDKPALSHKHYFCVYKSCDDQTTMIFDPLFSFRVLGHFLPSFAVENSTKVQRRAVKVSSSFQTELLQCSREINLWQNCPAEIGSYSCEIRNKFRPFGTDTELRASRKVMDIDMLEAKAVTCRNWVRYVDIRYRIHAEK